MHADLFGSQEVKYEWCRKNEINTVNWVSIHPRPPFYMFIPQTSEVRGEYDLGIKITDLLPVNSVGIVTARDHLAIHDTKEEVWKVVQDFGKLPPETARAKYELGKDARDWQVKLAQADLKNTGPIKNKVVPILYRPFDIRWTYYTPTSRGFLCMPRGDVMKHLLNTENIGLVTSRMTKGETFQHAQLTRNIVEVICMSPKTSNNGFVFPLYLYNPPINWDTQLLGTGQDGRRANLAPGFVARLGGVLGLQWVSDGRGDGRSTLGPEDVLAYIYAIFHAPSYRSRYAEFLKIDFPRVPLTNDPALFWELVERGRELIGLHLLEGDGSSVMGNGKKPITHNPLPITPAGEVAPGYPKYENGKVVINKAGEGFSDVSSEVWNFHIGGYQVAHKWLKDRKGRVLSDEDAAHYRKILYALEITIEHMRNIDLIIEEHGGWPLPGSQDASTLSDEDVKSFFAAGDATEVKSRPAKTKPNVGAQRAAPKTPKALPSRNNLGSAKRAQHAAPLQNAVRPIGDYSRDELIPVLKKVVKRKWVLRDDAIRDSARVLGFARTGRQIQAAFRSAINGAIRRGILEYDGDWIRRAKSRSSGDAALPFCKSMRVISCAFVVKSSMMNSQLLSQLQAIVGDGGVLSHDDDLMVYECDAFVAAKQRPDYVVFPTSTQQVSELVKFARAHNLIVVPRGAGTGLAGGSLAESGSLMIVTSRMNNILEVDIPNRCALVEAGVVNLHLQQATAPYKYCFAPDPSSQAAATIGGGIANNSGGPHTLKYGVMVNHTLGVELVTPDGEIVWLGGRVENMPGMDLLGACCGSEGTLGIVTRAWVKLVRLPAHASTLLAIFDDFDSAAQCVSDIIAAGIIPAALEMLDDIFIPPIEAAYKFGFPLDAAAILLIETDGLKEGAEDEAHRAAEIARNAGAREVREAKTEKDRKLLWAARKGAFGAIGRVTPSYVTQDGVVPRSKIAPMLREVKEISARHGVITGNVFHAGDGNLHPCILFDERDVTQLPRVLAAGEEILKRCVDYGGSVTGEHGIGIEKVNMMEYSFTPDTLSAMRDLRAVFNPDDNFNPSKLMPTARGCAEINKAFAQAETAAIEAGTFLRKGAPV